MILDIVIYIFIGLFFGGMVIKMMQEPTDILYPRVKLFLAKLLIFCLVVALWPIAVTIVLGMIVAKTLSNL